MKMLPQDYADILASFETVFTGPPSFESAWDFFFYIMRQREIKNPEFPGKTLNDLYLYLDDSHIQTALINVLKALAKESKPC